MLLRSKPPVNALLLGLLSLALVAAGYLLGRLHTAVVPATAAYQEAAAQARQTADAADRLGLTQERAAVASELGRLQAQLARQDARIGELHQQMLRSSELIQSLAEQNTQLVQRVEANRVRVRWLTLAVLLLGLGLWVMWALGR